MAILATQPLSYRKEDIPETYPPGRSCESCGTLLSIYNPGNRCWPHTPAKRIRMGDQGDARRQAFVDALIEVMEEP